MVDESNRDNVVDAPVSARLLSSDDQSDRKSSESEESFLEEELSAQELFSYNEKRGRLSYLRRNWKWIVPILSVLAVICVALFSRPYIKVASSSGQHSPEPSSQHSPAPASHLSVSGFSGPRNTFTFSNGTQFVKPSKLKVIGVVFYGRRQFVNVLECYLRRNLRVNGGMLDEIYFMLHTIVQEDIDWLNDLIKRDRLSKYYKVKTEDLDGKWHMWGLFPNLYRKLNNPDAIYIKIDDDVIFIDDYAVPELVRTTLEHPEAHNIQANIINNKWNHWHHFRTDAIWPYLPDRTSAKWPEDSWRPSELPRYRGPMPELHHDFHNNYSPPSLGHRWLPLEPSYENLSRTPYADNLRNPQFKTEKTNPGWAIGAQAHSSFFENHERSELKRYDFGSAFDGTWNRWYIRYNINMMAIRGSIILKNPIWSERYRKTHRGDEFLFTVKIPKDLNMPVLIATRAIAVHFAFRDSRPDMLKTDVLDRYRALANELYCKADNYKPRLGSKLGPHHTPGSKAHQKGEENGTGSGSGDEEVGDGPQDMINADGHSDDDDSSSSSTVRSTHQF